MVECSFTNQVVVGSSPIAIAQTSGFVSVSSKEILDIQVTIVCGFTLKRLRDMIRTYTQMHRTDKCSQQSLIIWPFWLNSWFFVYELSGCGFESRCSHLNFKLRACFEQAVPWYSGNYRAWIHSETGTWHDKNIQSLIYWFVLKALKLWNQNCTDLGVFSRFRCFFCVFMLFCL